MNRIDDTFTSPSPDLAARLLRLREAAARIEPPGGLEDALRMRLRTRSPSAPAGAPHRPSSRSPMPARGRFGERWSAWLAWPVTVTAAAGLMSWVVYSHPAIAPTPRAGSTPYETRIDTDVAATPFLALTSLDEIPSGGRGEVVMATLPRATLAEFGLPVSPMLAAEPIGAEFLVAPDGGVLAVRFVETGGR
jgi:hypothetical protein